MVNTSDRYANGKLLLTGEYLVLAGARALALPVRFGQKMSVTETTSDFIEWIASDTRGTWLQARFSTVNAGLCELSCGKPFFAQQLLQAAASLNPSFLKDIQGLRLHFELNYPREWGLGSSSSLIWLISSLAGLDVYQLYPLISKGSGYDVACASRDKPFFYTRGTPEPTVECTTIGAALSDHAVFAYLGIKQDTQTEVDRFLSSKSSYVSHISIINTLGEAIHKESDGQQLCRLIQEHEAVLAGLLNKEPVSSRFPGFPGAVKSLGAWGGDFALFTSPHGTGEIKKLLTGYGLKHIFTYDEIII
jgi:mevalonate kinase